MLERHSSIGFCFLFGRFDLFVCLIREYYVEVRELAPSSSSSSSSSSSVPPRVQVKERVMSGHQGPIVIFNIDIEICGCVNTE